MTQPYGVSFRTTLGNYPERPSHACETQEEAERLAREGLAASQAWDTVPLQFARVTCPDGSTMSVEYGRG